MTIAAPPLTKVPNYVNGQWVESTATEWFDVTNPATGEIIAKAPLSDATKSMPPSKPPPPPIPSGAALLRKTAFSRCSS